MKKKSVFLKNIKNDIEISNIYNLYFYRLSELALTRFSWEAVPSSIDTRYLELQLLNQGYCIFFKDDILEKYLALGGVLDGKLDVYGTPIKRTAIGENNYRKECDNNNSVIIYNNLFRTTPISVIRQYAYYLSQIQKMIDVNVKGQKTPIILKTNPKTKLSIQNAYEQYSGDNACLVVDENFGLDNIKPLNIEVPYKADTLFLLYQNYFNDYLSFLGIENTSTTKKERLIFDEFQGSQGQTRQNRTGCLMARKAAAKQINELFGLNIKVVWNDNYINDNIAN